MEEFIERVFTGDDVRDNIEEADRPEGVNDCVTLTENDASDLVMLSDFVVEEDNEAVDDTDLLLENSAVRDKEEVMDNVGVFDDDSVLLLESATEGDDDDVLETL